MFYRKGVFRNFAKFSGKHLCKNLFINKVAGLSLSMQLYWKKRFLHRCFPVNFVKFLRTSFLTEHLWWLFLVLQHRCSYKFLDIHKKILVLRSLFNTVRDLKACNFNKKETSTQAFSREYHNIFKNGFFMEHSGGCFWIRLKNF